MDWYLSVLKKYAVFDGRARPKEFWMFTLFNTIVIIVAEIIDIVLGTMGDTGVGLISGLYSLGVFLPSMGVMIRRLHDAGKSGWLMRFCAFLP